MMNNEEHQKEEHQKKDRDLEIRAGTPGTVLRPASRGPWVPEAGDDTRPLPEETGGVGLGQDPRPETEAGTSAPGRHRRQNRLDRHGPRDEPAAPGRHPAGSPGRGSTTADISAQLHVTEAGGPQRPGPGTGEPTTKAPRDPSGYRSSQHSKRPGAGPGQEGITMETEMETGTEPPNGMAPETSQLLGAV